MPRIATTRNTKPKSSLTSTILTDNKQPKYNEEYPSDIAQSRTDSPIQPRQPSFPKTIINKKLHSFGSKWYELYKHREYSVQRDAVYCFLYRLFPSQSGHIEQTFVKIGFRNWKKANSCFMH